MKINLEKKGDVSVAHITGKLDTNTASFYENEIFPLIDVQPEKNAAVQVSTALKLVLELQGMDYVSSAGLRVLIITAKKIKSKNGSLILSGMQKQIKNIFDISGLSTIFQIVPSLEEALSKI